MSEQEFDLVVIGAGPAGYPAAIRAAQNGLKAACIDDWQNHDGSRSFGGTCLNAGCIPSKALLESSELYHRAATEFGKHGIELGSIAIDVARMHARKAGIVKQLTGGIAALFKSNGVTALQGRGRLLGDGRVEHIDASGKSQVLRAQNIVIATGSVPVELPVARFDGERIVDSWAALELDEAPARLGVIGAGVIGLELGSVWRRLGSEVVILEALETLLPMVDPQIAKDAARHFKKQGLDIRLGAKLTAAKQKGDGVELVYESGGQRHTLEVDKLVVCVGRRPFTENLRADGIELPMTERGFIEVDEHCRTKLPGVWAIGDVVRGPMLAHKGTEEGVMVADLIAGKFAEVNYDVIPSVIYTAPEIAWVGKTETELAAASVEFKIGTFSFGANGRAKGMEQAEGLVKLIAAADDDTLLGVHIIGPLAGELIAEAVLAMEFSASSEDLQRTVHAHPTLSEALHEAALAADKRAIHAINR
ncbi:MAG TPA: dihydrolipoyl dehydrogenase [Gammaproteobacteria bacterium]|nr:dihydrolipoyl dehydrogenase [Gammaproteobacteria bacterium]